MKTQHNSVPGCYLARDELFGWMPMSIGGWLAHAIHEESRCTQNFHVDWFENDRAFLEHRTTHIPALHTVSKLNSATPINIQGKNHHFLRQKWFHLPWCSSYNFTAKIKYRLHPINIYFYSCRQQLLLQSPPANNYPLAPCVAQTHNYDVRLCLMMMMMMMTTTNVRWSRRVLGIYIPTPVKLYIQLGRSTKVLGNITVPPPLNFYIHWRSSIRV